MSSTLHNEAGGGGEYWNGHKAAPHHRLDQVLSQFIEKALDYAQRDASSKGNSKSGKEGQREKPPESEQIESGDLQRDPSPNGIG